MAKAKKELPPADGNAAIVSSVDKFMDSVRAEVDADMRKGRVRLDQDGHPIDPDQTSIEPIALADLVLDAELQCRAAGLDPEVVKEYTEALKGGASFPPVEVVRVDERHYLVDGWHREAATRNAGRPTILARIVPGTRRDAVLAAASANPVHGLKRSHEDKRKAVRLLLMDPECAKLSGRKFGEIIRVSHTYVDEMRKHYGLTPGMVLTAEHRERTDGEATAPWRLLHAGQEKFTVGAIERIRKCATLDDLARVTAHSEVEKDAIALRLTEFQTRPWPWGAGEGLPGEEDDAYRRRVVAEIDSVEDARAALQTVNCPEPMSLLHILANVCHLTGEWGYHHFDELEATWKGRTALIDAIRDARKARAAKVAADPSATAFQIHRAKSDVDAQRAAFEAASPEGRRACNADALAPEVRDGPFRAALSEVGEVNDCADPTCKGWVTPGEHGRCVTCRKTAREVDAMIRGVLRGAAILVGQDGYGFEPAVGVVIDWPTVRFLSLLTEELGGGGEPAWLAKLPASVRHELRDWRDRVPVAKTGIMVSIVEDHEPEAPAEEVDAVETGCQGHPAGPEDSMGETVYCDGSCRAVSA